MILPGRRKCVRDAAQLAYRRVVEQSRQPVFYVEYGVPDTFDGRFELICLHAFLYLHRLKSEHPRARALAQAFFDTMFGDLDRTLREIGTGDLRVGKEVKRMARGFYGRIRAYEGGIAAGDSVLGTALARNLFGTVGASPGHLDAVTAYLRVAADALRRQAAADLLAGRIDFVCPQTRGPQPAGSCR